MIGPSHSHARSVGGFGVILQIVAVCPTCYGLGTIMLERAPSGGGIAIERALNHQILSASPHSTQIAACFADFFRSRSQPQPHLQRSGNLPLISAPSRSNRSATSGYASCSALSSPCRANAPH